MSTLREDLLAYAEKIYGAEPEYLWRRYPAYAVLRHKDNSKWFALVMDVPAKKLGLTGEEWKDILNVKLSDPLLADILVQQKGFFRGYHISRGSWVSILLDGSVPFEEVCRWLQESYLATASREEKERLRPPKEWIVPSNPKYYSIRDAFDRAEDKVIDWKQGKGIRRGDIVYLYVAAPVSAILYMCQVTETEIPYRFDRGDLHMTHLMKIRLLKQYPQDAFTFERLGKEFGIKAVRGPRGIPQSLSQALNPDEKK